MRRVALLAVVALAASVAATAARADGDPASDVLPIDPVYFPLSGTPAAAKSALASAVSAVYAKGNRVRVAVIATPEDLGAIPSLMNKPGDYAQFLGQELSAFYVGPLLVVMPKGFGIYDGGRPVTAESAVLSRVDVSGSSTGDLAKSAADAVQKLDTAGALRSPDIRAPWVYPSPATIRPGKTASFGFRLLDDSDRASVAIKVIAGAKTLAALAAPLSPTAYPKLHTVSWRVPVGVPKKGVKVCMTAKDAAGNTSHPACLAVKVA